MDQCVRLPKSKYLICSVLKQQMKTQQIMSVLWTWGWSGDLLPHTSLDYEARKWSDYLEKICSLIFSCHANSHLFILVNDKHGLPYSIKYEHYRRVPKHFYIPNVFSKWEDKFPPGSNFRILMLNSGNKVRLQKLLKELLITKARWVQGTPMYCESHMSTNHQYGDIALCLQSSWSSQNDAVYIWQPQKYNGLQWSSSFGHWIYRCICPSSFCTSSTH